MSTAVLNHVLPININVATSRLSTVAIAFKKLLSAIAHGLQSAPSEGTAAQRAAAAEAQAVRLYAKQFLASDRSFALELMIAADRHESLAQD